MLPSLLGAYFASVLIHCYINVHTDQVWGIRLLSKLWRNHPSFKFLTARKFCPTESSLLFYFLEQLHSNEQKESSRRKVAIAMVNFKLALISRGALPVKPIRSKITKLACHLGKENWERSWLVSQAEMSFPQTCNFPPSHEKIRKIWLIFFHI